MPWIDRVHGIIERRVLLNWRVAPEHLAPLLPPGLAPQVIGGWGIGGVCCIRLARLRPRGLPGFLGLRAESAAHRIAVRWPDAPGERTGVYVPRRESAARSIALLGGRCFPGVHGRARFTVEESQDGADAWRGRIVVDDAAGRPLLRAALRSAAAPPADSVFATTAAARVLAMAGGVGISPRRDGALEALELRCGTFPFEPLAIDEAWSALFDPGRFPAGAIALDSAFLMRDVPHAWANCAAPAAVRGGA